MEASEENLSTVVEAFQAAAVGAGAWTTALEGLAAVTGSRSGQLIGLGGDAGVPFNWVTGFPDEAWRSS